jgi:hypothetical protein
VALLMTDDRPTKGDELLEQALAAHGKSNCPSCSRKIDRGDVAWNDGDTEAGTPYTHVEIQCQQCETEIVNFCSWWPGGSQYDFDDTMEHVLKDWE